jgi:hypothetical protein
MAYALLTALPNLLAMEQCTAAARASGTMSRVPAQVRVAPICILASALSSPGPCKPVSALATHVLSCLAVSEKALVPAKLSA